MHSCSLNGYKNASYAPCTNDVVTTMAAELALLLQQGESEFAETTGCAQSCTRNEYEVGAFVIPRLGCVLTPLS